MANVQNAPVNAFARAPGQNNSGDILDYSQDASNKLYKSATAPLVSLHDLSAGNLRDFLQLLEQERVGMSTIGTRSPRLKMMMGRSSIFSNSMEMSCWLKSGRTQNSMKEGRIAHLKIHRC